MLLSEFRSRVISYIEGLLVEYDLSTYFSLSSDGSSYFIFSKPDYKEVVRNLPVNNESGEYRIFFLIDGQLNISIAQNNMPLYKIANCKEEEEEAFLLKYELELREYFETNILTDKNFNDLWQRMKRYKHARNVFSNRANVGPKNLQNNYLNEIEIVSYYSIKHPLKVESLSNKKEIYFLGENGDGKTLLLQAIILGLKGNYIFDETFATETGIIFDMIKENPRLKIESIDSENNVYQSSQWKKSDEKQKAQQCIFAYGVHRSKSHKDYEEKYGFLTLFSDKFYLKHPIHWLKELQRLNGLGQGLKLETAEHLLEQILDGNVVISVGVEVEFIERGNKTKFEQLSEGYKSVITWVADMLARLAEAQPEVTDIKDYKGIVLVDEISLHLHPNWEYGLANKLRTWFPQVQFFFTTHSPVTIMGASDDAVIYRLYKEDGSTKISEPYYAKDMKHLMANSILTSPLFNMEKATMRAQGEWNKDVDTSDDYLHSRIYDLVKKELEKRESEGKVYHSKAMIDGLIQKIMKTQLGKQ